MVLEKQGYQLKMNTPDILFYPDDVGLASSDTQIDNNLERNNIQDLLGRDSENISLYLATSKHFSGLTSEASKRVRRS